MPDPNCPTCLGLGGYPRCRTCQNVTPPKVEPPGTLRLGEPHPCAYEAAAWIRSTLSFEELSLYQASFSSCAIEGNRQAEILSETLRRFMSREPVSDRYLLGLAWALRDLKEP